MSSFLSKLIVPPREHKDKLPPRLMKALRILGYISLPFFPLFCLLVLDYMNFSGLTALKTFVTQQTMSLLFEIIVMEVLFLDLTLLCGRVVISGGIMGFLSILCAYINYTKMALNGNHFHPRDITMVSDLGGLSTFISGNVPIWYIIGSIVIVIWVVAFGLLGTRLPLRWFVRLPILAVGLLITAVSFSNSTKSNAILGKFGMSFMDSALQTSNYRANGFVGAFTINTLMLRTEPPEGYSEAAIDALLEGYSGSPASSSEKYDVIVVLSESFFDVRRLNGTTFSENPIPNYDRIIDLPGAYSGMMYSTASGGGTVRPEFEILTGLSTDYLHDVSSPYELVNGPVEGFVSNYKAAGYHTVAYHPYHKAFYSRDKAYGNIGFDEFLGAEDVADEVYLKYRRGLVTDESSLRVMEHILDDSAEPAFLLTITMECHQPYTPMEGDVTSITVQNPNMSDDVLGLVTVFTNGLHDADAMLGDLVDYIDGRERPTILLFFGDHIPSLGANRAAYVQSGTAEQGNSAADNEFYYSGPFIIYSNTGAESHMLTSKKDNKVSSYYLLEIIAEMTGSAETPYMQLLADYYEKVPYYHVRLDVPETEDIKALKHMHELISYDRIMGERYSVK